MVVKVKKPVVIRMINHFRNNHMSIGLFCLEFDRWDELATQEWLDAGKLDLNFVSQGFKCNEYGGRADKQFRPKLTGLSTETVYLRR